MIYILLIPFDVFASVATGSLTGRPVGDFEAKNQDSNVRCGGYGVGGTVFTGY